VESAGSRGPEGERAFCLQAWNGDTGHTIDRIGLPAPFHVEAAACPCWAASNPAAPFLSGGSAPGWVRATTDSFSGFSYWSGRIPNGFFFGSMLEPHAGTRLFPTNRPALVFSKLVELDAEDPLRVPLRAPTRWNSSWNGWRNSEAKIRGTNFTLLSFPT